MKGTLTKKEQGWYVTYGSAAGREVWPVSLPLHPDFVEMMDTCFTSKFTQEVEFEIVDMWENGEVGVNGLRYAKLIHSNNFDTKPGFAEKRIEQMLEIIANEEFKNVGDEGLFPNHTDKDIWIAGFKAGFKYRDR